MANLRTHRAVLADIIDLHLDPAKPHTIVGKDGRLKISNLWHDELVVTPTIFTDETVEAPVTDETGVVVVGRRRNKKTTK